MVIDMEKMLDLISKEVQDAFSKSCYNEKYGKVTLSNRPDLCQFQCNGAMAAAKEYKKAPIVIAKDVAEQLLESRIIKEADPVAPGFLNLKVKESFLVSYLRQMREEENFGLNRDKNPKTMVVDYGGPNVAKPLHVGHLRSAIIGESLKRMGTYLGHRMIGDIHLGDWGLQMGLIITELKERQPQLPYFDLSYEGDYPKTPPFTIEELEEIYPAASEKSKKDQFYKEEAMEATFLLQKGNRGYRALWNHILDVSVKDLKKNYKALHVEFELWNGESNVQDRIPAMVQSMRDNGYAYESEGALVVDVKEERDTKEIPPCMILKSDGASLYNTTDLATIEQRMEEIDPDEILYVVDKRQDLYFEQVFRCARKTKLVKDDTKLTFIGFGTMNGKDGKPFKTREGGVMRLEHLMASIQEEMEKKIEKNKNSVGEEMGETAKLVGLSALKYGDLSNQASKDYIFDMDRFTSFEGNTGPYILYTIVRIKSILSKYEEMGGRLEGNEIKEPSSEGELDMMLGLAQFNGVVENAFEEKAPHKICAYVYELANGFNRFYHETKILSEKEAEKKSSWIALLLLTRDILETNIHMLGFDAPERM